MHLKRFFAGLLCFATIAATGLISTNANAADQKKKARYAVTDIRKAGPDYYFQGEYTGNITTTLAQTHHTNFGLQVIALGNGQFDGMLYTGGLPGSGWNGVDRTPLSGRRQAGVVILQAQGISVEVIKNQYAQVSWNGYPATGSMRKVQRVSPYLSARPPKGAYILFDGKETNQLVDAQLTPDGLLKEGTQTASSFRDFYMHLEFRLPFMPNSLSQARANSGVYIQSRYELQILDSFGRIPEYNYCGALYKQRIPDLNMCLPPLTWQTYDIRFTQPEYDAAGYKVKNAQVTAWLNGVIIHDHVDIIAKTGGGQQEGPFPLPTKFQNHRDPVRFQNIWLIEYSKDLPDPIQSTQKLPEVSVVQ